MQAKYTWLLLPPVLAVLVILGPLGGSPSDTSTTTPPTATAQTPRSAVPASPTLSQVVSTLLGVLLLGGVGIVAFAKLRDRAASHSDGPVTVRQTLRLSPRHVVHVLEFDERLLLLGECDGNVTVLEGAGGPQDDEREVAERETGAVPRDLVIPAAPARRQPRRPRESASPSKERSAINPGDFKALLELARSGGVKE